MTGVKSVPALRPYNSNVSSWPSGAGHRTVPYGNSAAHRRRSSAQGPLWDEHQPLSLGGPAVVDDPERKYEAEVAMPESRLPFKDCPLGSSLRLPSVRSLSVVSCVRNTTHT